VTTILVAGFGPFGEVIDNPSARIASAVDGASAGGVRIIGREMPVSYRRSPALCCAWVAEFGVAAVIGVGVAVSRTGVTVERTACRPGSGVEPDVDGSTRVELAAGSPAEIQSTMDVDKLALLLGAVVGDDAGRYVCNAWLYQALQCIDVPVGFLHVPPAGLNPDRLRIAIGDMWGA
jgi:pyroglutamyl-peptidase